VHLKPEGTARHQCGNNYQPLSLWFLFSLDSFNDTLLGSLNCMHSSYASLHISFHARLCRLLPGMLGISSKQD